MTNSSPPPPGNDESEEACFGLRLAFDTDDPEFVRGYEIGRYDTLLDRDGEAEGYLRSENAEMAMRLAESHHLSVVATDLGYDWMWAVFSPPIDPY